MTADAAIPAELEQPLIAVETCLTQLGEALAARDPAGIERHSVELHHLLTQAVAAFSAAAQAGRLPASLRQRLVQAGGRMAAQREALARGNVSLDRALDVLIPAEPVYGASGLAERRPKGGSFFSA
ncbi:hypothetical protein [Roseateles sp.]|uniref:hypothetical protein n=1 Tax=Roseateles sp. TaxID=1971397 RepID=UPI0039274284